MPGGVKSRRPILHVGSGYKRGVVRSGDEEIPGCVCLGENDSEELTGQKHLGFYTRCVPEAVLVTVPIEFICTTSVITLNTYIYIWTPL